MNLSYVICILLAIFYLVQASHHKKVLTTGWDEDDIDEAMNFVQHHIERPIDSEMDLQQTNFCPTCFQMEVYGVCVQAANQVGQLKRLNPGTLPLYKFVLAQALERLGHNVADLDPAFIEDFFQDVNRNKKAVCEQLVKQFPVWTDEFWFNQFDLLEKKINGLIPIVPPNPQPPKVIFKIEVCRCTGDPHCTPFTGTSIVNPENELVQPNQHIGLYRFNGFSVYIDTYGRGLTSKIWIKSATNTLVISPTSMLLNNHGFKIAAGHATPLGHGMVIRQDNNRFTFQSAEGITILMDRVPHNNNWYFNTYIDAPENLVSIGNGKCVLAKVVNDDDLQFEDKWDSPELKAKAEKACSSFKLNDVEKNNCLRDVQITKDPESALVYSNVAKDISIMDKIAKDEESNSAHVKIFQTLANLLEQTKEAQILVKSEAKNLTPAEKKRFDEKIQSFLSESEEEVERIRDLNGFIGAEILDESLDE